MAKKIKSAVEVSQKSKNAKFEIIMGFALILVGGVLTLLTLVCGIPFFIAGLWMCYDGWVKLS